MQGGRRRKLGAETASLPPLSWSVRVKRGHVLIGNRSKGAVIRADEANLAVAVHSAVTLGSTAFIHYTDHSERQSVVVFFPS